MNALGVLEDVAQTARDRMSDNESDFEGLFLRHYPAVYGILMRLLRNSVEAEELAIEVFWKLSKRPSGGFFSRPIAPWLYRTATNAGLDALRTAKRRQQYEANAPLAAQQEQPLEKVLRDEDCRAVQDVLSQMKPAQAQLLLMRADGCSYKDLAAALGVRISSVGTLLARAEAEFHKRYLDLAARKEKP